MTVPLLFQRIQFEVEDLADLQAVIGRKCESMGMTFRLVWRDRMKRVAITGGRDVVESLLGDASPDEDGTNVKAYPPQRPAGRPVSGQQPARAAAPGNKTLPPTRNLPPKR